MLDIFHRRTMGRCGKPVATNQEHSQWPAQQRPEYQTESGRRRCQLTHAGKTEIPFEEPRPGGPRAVATGHGHRAANQAIPGIQPHQLGHHHTDQILQCHQHDHQHREQQHGPAAPAQQAKVCGQAHGTEEKQHGRRLDAFIKGQADTGYLHQSDNDGGQQTAHHRLGHVQPSQQVHLVNDPLTGAQHQQCDHEGFHGGKLHPFLLVGGWGFTLTATDLIRYTARDNGKLL